MPEQVELWRNTGQRGLLIASYKRLKKDTYRAITFHGGSLCPCTLVPASQAAAPPSRSNLTGADLPQIIKKKKKKSCVYAHSVASVLSSSLRPCRLWLARLFGQIRGSPGKNTGAYWPILVAIPFQSTIFPTTLAADPPEDLVLPEPLWPKQLHHLHTRPSQGQTQVLQGRK